MTSLPSRLDRALSDLPRRYPGPGGAVAMLRDGEVLERRAWGFADAERRIPFTPRTLFRICSITKQFTCALLLDPHPDPSKRETDVLALPCPRALDHSPPGGWPLRFSRDGAGRVEGVTVGCWLARGLRYERVR